MIFVNKKPESLLPTSFLRSDVHQVCWPIASLSSSHIGNSHDTGIIAILDRQLPGKIWHICGMILILVI